MLSLPLNVPCGFIHKPVWVAFWQAIPLSGAPSQMEGTFACTQSPHKLKHFFCSQREPLVVEIPVKMLVL